MSRLNAPSECSEREYFIKGYIQGLKFSKKLIIDRSDYNIFTVNYFGDDIVERINKEINKMKETKE